MVTPGGFYGYLVSGGQDAAQYLPMKVYLSSTQDSGPQYQ